MAIVRAQISGIENLAEWLNENATHLLQKVEKDASEEAWNGYDLEGNEIFSMSASVFKAYRTDGGDEISKTFYSLGFNASDIVMCDNGIIIDADTLRNASTHGRFTVMLSKTNIGNLACIFTTDNNTAVSRLYSGVQHVAIGDSTTMSTTTTFTPEAGQQTCLVPFATNANIGDTSYTPDAFYIPMNPNYAMGIGKFLMGADTYISNGYWAIRDGGVQ